MDQNTPKTAIRPELHTKLHSTKKPRQPYSKLSLISRHGRMVKTLIDISRAGPDGGLNNAEWRAAKARGSLLKLVELTGEAPIFAMARLRLTADEIARIGEFHRRVTTVWIEGPDPEIESLM